MDNLCSLPVINLLEIMRVLIMISKDNGPIHRKAYI